MSTLTYSVPDVSCGHCRTAITNEVAAAAARRIRRGRSRHEDRHRDRDPLDEQAIVAAIDEAGYEVAA